MSLVMVSEARRRCEHLNNVELSASNGCDLVAVESESIDVVLAVDSFPYVYQCGGDLLTTHFAEAARVLRPGGALCVFELSYGRTAAADTAYFHRLASGADLEVLDNGDRPFKLWDGLAFRARKPTSGP